MLTVRIGQLTVWGLPPHEMRGLAGRSPDVTPDERQDYTARVAAAKAAIAPERFQMVKAVVQAAEPTLTPDQVETRAHARLAQQDEGVLPPDFLLYFHHRTTAVRVADLSDAYDGLRLADPGEPTYRDGTDAVFHWHRGHWLINSFAHGLLHTYRADLEHQPPQRRIPDMTQPWHTSACVWNGSLPTISATEVPSWHSNP
jgi:hypothetical protein